MTYTENDIRRHVSDNAFRAGLLYRQQHRVVSCEAGEDGHIRSRVQGNERRPYEQAIVIGRSPRGVVTIEGDCTCPVGFNCKHVAAALLEVLTRGKGTPGPTGTGLDARAHHRIGAVVSPSASAPSAPLLPREIAAWLEDLERARTTAGEDYPKEIAQRIVYVLAPFERGRAARLLVTPISTRLLKDGRFSESGRPYDAANALSSAAPAKFLRPADLRIFRALTLVRREYGLHSETPLSGEGGWSILSDILATGRARWLSVNGPVLVAGEAREGHIVWAAEAAAMRPRLQIGDGLPQGPGSAVIVLNAVPPLYVDPAAGTIGLVETGYPPKLVAALLVAPRAGGALRSSCRPVASAKMKACSGS